MKNIAAMDIETFFPKNKLDRKELKYLKKKAKDRLEITLNPYVSIVISSAFFYPTKNLVEVIYLSENENRARENIEISDERKIEVNYIPIKINLDEVELAEKKLLQEVIKKLEGIGKLVTFNGLSFDIEFIKIRAIYHDLDLDSIERFLAGGKDHFDLMKYLSFGKRAYSLQFISTQLGIPMKKGPIRAEDVEKCFLKGRYEDIAKYNARDSIIEGLLFEKIHCSLSSSIIKNIKISSGAELIEYCVQNELITKNEASELIDYLVSLLEDGHTHKKLTIDQINYLRLLKNRCLEKNIEIKLEDLLLILRKSTLRKILERESCQK